MEDAYLLMCQKKISNLQQILPVLEHIARSNRPLVIIADDVDGVPPPPPMFCCYGI